MIKKTWTCLPVFLCIASLAMGQERTTSQKQAAAQERPNIILIMADDMGYSDLGCYGSEIRTPNLDRLAAGGLRFTNFYNAARCCPTRASLLTGVYPHQAGMGGMVSRDPDTTRTAPYQGYLSKNTVTLAEALGRAGYYCSMSGKWHVAEEHPNWPMDRGFDDYYGLISGAANYFDITLTKHPGLKRHFAKGNQEYMPPREGFYMTDAITEHALETLEGRAGKKEPFFMYVAYTAPHYPLHALPEDIARYKGRYTEGWDKLREERYLKQKELGIADGSMQLSPRDPQVPSWEEAENKELLELKMEIYAAQIDRMDQGIGHILEKLEETGETGNTLVLFLADNGGCAEGGLYGHDFRNNGTLPGGVESYQSYGRGWANASNTPFRYYKQWVHEGGIATPFIVRWPARIKDKGSLVRQPAHIIDIMATLLEAGKADYPANYKGRQIVPLQGLSLIPSFTGKPGKTHEYLFWEHVGNMAVMKGKWKLVSQQKEGDGKWALYDLETDRAEERNLAGQYPELAAELFQAYKEWGSEVGINKKIMAEFLGE